MSLKEVELVSCFAELPKFPLLLDLFYLQENSIGGGLSKCTVFRQTHSLKKICVHKRKKEYGGPLL